MATWKQVRDYIMSEFNGDYDEESDLLTVVVSVQDKEISRSQSVVIAKHESKDLTWIHVYSKIGSVNKNDIYALLREAADPPTLGIIALNDEIWCRSEIFLNDDVDLDYIGLCIKQLGVWADYFEERYVGGDEN